MKNYAASMTPAHYQFVIYQTIVAFKYIHSAKVLHRDIKPNNILVDKESNVRVCDFGMSRKSDEANEDPNLTLEEVC